MTVNPEGAFSLTGVTTLSGDKTTTDPVKALDYVVTISDYDKDNYAYTFELKVGGAAVSDFAPTVDNDGKFTIPGATVTGNIELTVTRALKGFSIELAADYLSGWTLILVTKDGGGTDSIVYNYDGNAMYYVEGYGSGAYAYLVKGKIADTADKATEAAKAKVSLGTTSAGTIPGSSTAPVYDVNKSNKTDYSDTLLTYRCYRIKYGLEETSTAMSPEVMEIYLRADVDKSKKVDTTDVSLVDQSQTQGASAQD